MAGLVHSETSVGVLACPGWWEQQQGWEELGLVGDSGPSRGAED